MRAVEAGGRAAEEPGRQNKTDRMKIKLDTRTWSITTSVLVTLVTVALLPMIVTAYYNLRGSLAHAERSALHDLQQAATGVAQRLGQFIRDSHYLARYVARHDATIVLLGYGGAEADRNAAVLVRDLQRSYAQVELIMLMDLDGKVLASSNLKYLGHNYGFRDYFQVPLQRGEPFFSILAEVSTGVPTMFFSHPVYDGFGQLVGVAVVEIVGTAMWDLIAAEHDSREAFLIDGDGVLIFHPDKSRHYSSLMPLDEARLAQIRASRRFMRDDIPSLNLSELAAAAIGAREPGNVAYRDPAHGDVVAGFAPVPMREDWVVVVNERAERFAAPLNRLFDNVMFSVLLVGALFTVVAVLFARTIVRPLHVLTEHVRQLSEEGFSPSAGRGLATLARRDNEIGRLAAEFLVMQGRLQEHLRNLEETTAAKQRIEGELEVARNIQMGILPKIFPPFPDRADVNCDIYAAIEPAKEVGGDLYDFFRRDDGRIYFVIGDVSGKGVPASLYMAVTKTLLKAVAATAPDPRTVLATVNDQLAADNDVSMFVTLFCGYLDTVSGELLYANGGHNLPYIVSADGTVRRLEAGSGTVIGAVPGVPLAAGSTRLAPGDALFLYTDGVTEAADSAQQLYSEQRLQTCLQRLAGSGIRELVEGVMVDVKRFAGEAEQSDDITVMVVQLLR